MDAAAPRPLGIRVLDSASVGAFAFLVVAIAIRIGSLPRGGAMAVLVLGGLGLGYLLADLVSAIVHWAGDTFFREDTPLIGRAFIHPFREHHRDPRAITRHGFLEVNGNNCLALMPLLLPVWALGAGDAAGGIPLPFAQATALGFSLTTFATNQFHQWAHLPSSARPWLVHRLQATGFVLSPRHHARHHAPPHRIAYGITAGWFDPLLDRSRVFERLESRLRSLVESPSCGQGNHGDPFAGSRPA